MKLCPHNGTPSYPTPHAAWRVIQLRTGQRALVSHKQRGKPGGYAYRCKHCQQWHITHRPRWLPSRRPEACHAEEAKP